MDQKRERPSGGQSARAEGNPKFDLPNVSRRTYPRQDFIRPVSDVHPKITQLNAARERCEVNQQIAEWIIDLRARLERAQTPFWQTDYLVESPDDLKSEVERLRLCIRLARRAREGGGQ